MYNEASGIQENLIRLKRALQEWGCSWELIAVDDGSSDGTHQEVAVFSERHPEVRLLGYRPNRGRGYALRKGFAAARGKVVITTEADLTWGTDILRTLFEVVRQGGVDIGIASVHMKGSRMEGVPWSRRFLSVWGNRLLSAALDHKTTAVSGMTRSYRKEVLDSLDLRSHDKEIHLEILVKAYALGFHSRDIPATLRWTSGRGPRRVPWLQWLRWGGAHLRLVLRARKPPFFPARWTLLAILLLGAFLRSHQLGSESFWVDEITTLTVAQKPLAQIIENRMRVGHGPLYFILMRPWVALFGGSEAAVRFPSVVFGSASIGLVYLLAKALFDARTGSIASWLFCISTVHVWYSQEARMYSMAVFFALASSFFLIRALQTERKSFWAAQVSCAMLGVSIHASLATVALSQWIYIFLRRTGRSSKRVRIAAVFLAVMCGLWLLVLAARTREALFSWPSLSFPKFVNWAHKLFSEFFSLRYISMDLPKTAAGLAAYWSAEAFLIGLVLTSVWFGWKGRHRESARLLLLLFMGPVSAVLACSAWIAPQTRYVLFSSIPLYLFLAAYLAGLKQISRKCLLLGAVSAIQIFVAGLYFKDQVKTPWRDISAYVQSGGGLGQRVLVYPSSNEKVFSHYYKGPARVLGLKGAGVFQAARASREFWFVASLQGRQDEAFSRAVLKRLDLLHERREDRMFQRARVVRYVLRE